MSLPAFDTLADALSSAGDVRSPSELHGYLSGCCCSRKHNTAEGLALQLATYLECQTTDLDKLAGLRSLLEQTPLALASPDFNFYPLLPDDEQTLAERSAALGAWCEGFLAGFAERVGSDGRALSAETQEVIQDFVAIAQISTQDEDDDQNEGHFTELVEYLRMATINLYFDARNAADDAQATVPSLH